MSQNGLCSTYPHVSFSSYLRYIISIAYIPPVAGGRFLLKESRTRLSCNHLWHHQYHSWADSCPRKIIRPYTIIIMNQRTLDTPNNIPLHMVIHLCEAISAFNSNRLQRIHSLQWERLTHIQIFCPVYWFFYTINRCQRIPDVGICMTKKKTLKERINFLNGDGWPRPSLWWRWQFDRSQANSKSHLQAVDVLLWRNEASAEPSPQSFLAEDYYQNFYG